MTSHTSQLRLAPSVLVATYLAAVALVGPTGDVPLNDDWSYAETVRRFVETGAFRPGGWTSMPLWTHALWGALFSLPAGVSFHALRLSSVVAAAIGGVGVYVLADDAGWPRGPSAVLLAAWLLNPLTVAGSVTFMTDVPYAACTVWAAVFLCRHLRSGSDVSLAAGAALAVVATLSRQTGLVLPIAFLMAAVAARGLRPGALVPASLPLLGAGAALAAFGAWLDATGRRPALYAAKSEALAERLSDLAAATSTALGNTHGVLLTAGLVLAPVLGLLLASWWQADRSRAARAVGAGAAVVLGLSAARVGAGGPWRLPLLGNGLVESGVGPMTLAGPPPPPLPGLGWAVATVVGMAGAAVLVAALARGAARLWTRRAALGPGEAVGLFLVLAAGGGLAPLLPLDLFDRYLVSVLPLGMVGLGVLAGWPTPAPRRAAGVAWAGVALLAMFSVAATHDYLAWNRARWALLDRVAEVDPAVWARIDGGFEFNGATRYAPGPRPAGQRWWTPDTTDVLAFGPLPGYRTVADRPYRRWLPPQEDRVLWLRKSVP